MNAMSAAPTPTSGPRVMTAEQLAEQSDSIGRCELIHGELKMMSSAGGSHGDIASELNYQVRRFVKENGLGKAYAAETGFVLERNPDSVRAPDVAFIATARLAEAKTKKFIPIPPDLAAEVNSPSDRAHAVLEKVRWWLAHGVRLVWVVDPDTRTVTAYRPDGTAQLLTDDQTLDGADVLPGFELKLGELFAE